MKKIYSILFAAASCLMLAGCVQNGIDDNASLKKAEVAVSGDGQTILYASLGDAETKTEMSAFDGTWKPLWQKGDKISIFFDGSAAGVDFSLAKGAGMTMASFEGNAYGNVWTALYPASDAVSFDGTVIKLTLPDTQTYVDGGFGPDSYPMAAAPTSGVMQFRNLCSTIKVQLKGHHIVNSIVFTANDSKVSASGPATVKADFKDTPELKMQSEGSRSVTLDVGGLMLDPNKTTDFYIVLPAQTYTGGFSLKIITPTGSMTRSTTSDVTLKRSGLHPLTPFYVKLDEGLEPSTALEGSGTQDSPLLLKNLSDLIAMTSSVNAGAKINNIEGAKINASTASFRLENDLDLAALCSKGKHSWIPIGGDCPFLGQFDGNGHSITNLYIDTEKTKAGFFGNLTGIVKNLSVSGTVISTQTDAGIVVGYAGDQASIENCSAYGEISSSHTSGDSHIGGVVGNPNAANIKGCVNYASVSGGTCVGGVAGISGGKLSNCINYGSVEANNVGGGVAGFLYSGIMYNCVNYGEVDGYGDCGGITGGVRNDSKIANCLNAGDVYVSSGSIGGLFGYSFSNTGMEIANCVNVGNLLTQKSFNGQKGSLAGDSQVELTNCYWLYDPDAKLGIKDGIAVGEGKFCFALTADQINGIKSFTEPLYFNKEGIPSINSLDALNNWAADNSGEHEYWGWTFNNEDQWLSFTGEPATGGQGDVSTVFVVSPTDVSVSYEEYSFEVKVVAGMGHKISSMPAWISVENTDVTTSGDIITTLYTFKAMANPDYVERTDVIVLCNDDQKCIPVTVTQMEKVDESDVWKIKNFYHRSVGFKFTATWCQYCPLMAEEWDYAKEILGDKFQIATFHPTSSDLGFSETGKMESAYRVSGYPTGIVDSRADVYGGAYIKPVSEETEKAYGTSSGIEFTSEVSGNTIKLNVKLYIHKKGDYKITALLLEDNIIAGQQDTRDGWHSDYRHDNIVRLAFSEVTGDKFTLSSNNSIQSFKYSANIPSQCSNLDNLRILVYVERTYDGLSKVQKVSGVTYGNYSDYYIDNANTAPVGQKAEITFDDGSSKEEKYESGDFSADGSVTGLQSATTGNGIDIIITGDAFADKDQNVFNTYANRAMEAFFAVEPYSSLRDRFNVWRINAVSKNDFVGGNTKFSVRLGDGTFVEGNSDKIFEFVNANVPSADLTKTIIIVLVNQAVYAGTNFCWTSNEAIAFVPLQTSLSEFDATLRHEAAGHGFGKLDDEYYYGEPAPSDWISGRKEWQNLAYGFWENVDFTDDPEIIRWKTFLNDSRYVGKVGIYEGGGTYVSGVWRPTENSIMRYNYGHFNAPSREAIYKKIMRFSEGDDWTYDYEVFVNFDAKGRQEEAAYSYTHNNASAPSPAGKDFVPLHPPVLMQGR